LGFFSRVHRHDVAYLSKGVSNTLTLKYDMAGITTKTVDIQYDIFTIIADTLVLLYDIPLTYVSDTIELLYSIRPPLYYGYNLGTFTAMPSNDLGDFIA